MTPRLLDPAVAADRPRALAPACARRPNVAYWTDGKEERILVAALSSHLIAINAKTGEPCADFGEAGKVDLTKGMRQALQGQPQRRRIVVLAGVHPARPRGSPAARASFPRERR